MGETKASAATAPAAQPPVALVCTLSGLPKRHGALTAEAICNRFSLRIREALELPVSRSEQTPAGSAARWVKLEIKLLPRDRVEAVLTSRLHGKATSHPVLAVQVMDKSLDLGDIDRLARLAGQTLAGD